MLAICMHSHTNACADTDACQLEGYIKEGQHILFSNRQSWEDNEWWKQGEMDKAKQDTSAWIHHIHYYTADAFWGRGYSEIMTGGSKETRVFILLRCIRSILHRASQADAWISSGFSRRRPLCALGRIWVAFLLGGKVRISFHPKKPSGTTSKLIQGLRALQQSAQSTNSQMQRT